MSKPFNHNDIPLPLIPEDHEDDEDTKRKSSSFKLPTIVGDADSPKIGIRIKHLNGTESLRDALVFMEETEDLFQRMGFTNQNNGPSADAIVRQLLHGSALTTYSGVVTALRQDEFDTQISTARNAGGTNDEINARIATVARPPIIMDYVENGIQSIISFMAPFKVLARVKRYLRRGCRKPANMKTRVYMNHMTRINEEEIPRLPPDFSTNNSLTNDELMEIYHHSIPSSWSKEMQRQGFDPVEKTPTEFLEFCERMEASEDFQPDSTKSNNNKHDKGNRSKKHPKIRDDRPRGKGDRSGEPNNCMLHGPNTHPTSECYKLKKEAARLKELTNEYNKKSGGGKNKTWKRSADDNKKKASKDFNVVESKKKASGKSAQKKRKSDSDSDDDTVASLNNIDLKDFNYEDMDNLKIDSDSDGDDFHDAKQA